MIIIIYTIILYLKKQRIQISRCQGHTKKGTYQSTHLPFNGTKYRNGKTVPHSDHHVTRATPSFRQQRKGRRNGVVQFRAITESTRKSLRRVVRPTVAARLKALRLYSIIKWHHISLLVSPDRCIQILHPCKLAFSYIFFLSTCSSRKMRFRCFRIKKKTNAWLQTSVTMMYEKKSIIINSFSVEFLLRTDLIL